MDQLLKFSQKSGPSGYDMEGYRDGDRGGSGGLKEGESVHCRLIIPSAESRPALLHWALLTTI
jgi:hypothetical protein